VEIKEGLALDKIIGMDMHEERIIVLSNTGAYSMQTALEKLDTIATFTGKYDGGGIRGSLVSTLYLIGLTLLFATPLGIMVALFLNEFMKKGKLKTILSTLIDLLSGIPSVIYGLFGVVFIVPLTMKLTGASGGSLLSGALVLSIMLLPILIKTTEETLKVIAPEVRQASLALGASRVQTILKVVLPLSIRGILSAVLLAIARVIGESAALIYVVGTVIKDEISIFQGSTTLSVHIWSLMGGESPNLEASSAISMIILLLVLLFSVLMKLLLKERKVKQL
jgi:phosphate transport system permease protein